MISVVRPFSVEIPEKERPCSVIYIHEKPDGSLFYCAIDPDTQKQLLVNAQTVRRVILK